MMEELLEIGAIAGTLEALSRILMTCATDSDLPASAYVEALGLEMTLADYIRSRIEKIKELHDDAMSD